MAGLVTGTMQSSRILYSDRFAHDLRLTEQEIGIICHSLHVLNVAFSMELDYKALIDKVRQHLHETMEQSAIEL